MAVGKYALPFPSPFRCTVRLKKHSLTHLAFRNKRLSKGKKGIKKRTVDPFTRKDEYSLKVSFSSQSCFRVPPANSSQAPSTFQTRE